MILICQLPYGFIILVFHSILLTLLFSEAKNSRIATIGYGHTGHSYHALRFSLLRDCKQQVKLIINSFQRTWSKT